MKNMRNFQWAITLSVIIPAFSSNLNAQIKVFDNGNVGIKYTSTTPVSSLVLNAQGLSNYQAYFYNPNISVSGGTFYALTEKGSSTSKQISAIYGISNIGSGNFNYGVYGKATSSTIYTNGRAYGLYGIAGNATSGYNYGTYGYLYGSNNGAGVFGTTNGDCAVNGKYAGYFYGNVYVTGALWANPINPSDERIKENIVSLKSRSEETKFSLLNPVHYNLKQREFSTSDSLSVKQFYDPQGELLKKAKYGFIAQELKEIYPDLVYENEEGTLGIDYIGLIPILVNTVQEQQKRIDELEAKIDKLLKALETSNPTGPIEINN